MPKRKRKQRLKAIEHRIEHIDIEFTQRGKKRRLLRVQRHKEPIHVRDIDYTKNPDKITFLVLKTVFNDRLEIFAYKNNPQNFLISLNGEFVRLKHFKWREIQSAFMKLGKFLGFLK